MGMFDYITCDYPLPVDGANKLEYQTKDTPALFCDYYKITKDGVLMYQDYDIEDQSDRAKWLAENPNKKEPEWDFKSLMGCLTRVNERWVEVVDFSGKIWFYTFLKRNQTGWIEWCAEFKDGKIKDLKLIENSEE